MLWTREILLLVCLWFSSLDQNLAGIREIPLSKAPNAVDDQYFECTDVMDYEARGLLERELNGTAGFEDQWNDTAMKWAEVEADPDIEFPKGFTVYHGKAVIVYTDQHFHTAFKNAVKTNGISSADYKENFKFKAIHYYLTRALQILGQNPKWRYTGVVYRGTKTLYHYKEGEEIRFGHFASTSSNASIAKTYGTTTFYTIYTAFGVYIANLSHNASHEEVLIPVNEVFTVSPGRDGSNSYVLKSTGRACSYLNCAYLGNNKSEVCHYTSGSSRVISFHCPMGPSLLGGAVLLLHAATLRLFAGA